MTRPQTQTEPSERCSWVELVYCEGSELSQDEWIRMATILKRATSRTPDAHLPSILQDVANRDAQLWALIDSENAVVGGVVTQIVEVATGYTYMEIVACATENTMVEHESMREILSRLENVAHAMNCDAIRIVGRKGWGRIFSDFKEVNRVFDKVIREANG